MQTRTKKPKRLTALLPGSVNVGQEVLCQIDLHLPARLCTVVAIEPLINSVHGRVLQMIQVKTPWNISWFTLWDFGGAEVFRAD